jgi:heme A synthase
MKWFIIIFAVAIAIAIATGYMGGAKDATQNYQKVMLGNKYSK